MPETRWCLRVEYDGTRYVGWQVQPNGTSIQSTIQDALEPFLGHPARASSSGRTDAGVHALDQVVSFVTSAERSPKAVRDGLNCALPVDIAVIRAESVPLDFDPRRWVMRKTYRYRLLCRRARSAFRHRYTWQWRDGLDVEAMRAAAHHLVGRHDFSAFRAASCQAAHPVRTVEGLEVTVADDEVWLDVTGNGFLQHMVRIIAGTLVDVGRGHLQPDRVEAIRDGRDRSRAGRTAPARGLVLRSVELGDGPAPWKTKSD